MALIAAVGYPALAIACSRFVGYVQLMRDNQTARRSEGCGLDQAKDVLLAGDVRTDTEVRKEITRDKRPSRA